MSIKKKKNKKTKWVTALVFVGLLAVIGVAPLFVQNQGKSDEKIKVENESLTSYYTFSGTIEAKERRSVRSESNIQINEIKVEKGDSVKKGDVLLSTSTGQNVKAPLNGEVSEVLAEENQQVMVGTELFKIVNYSDLQLSMKVDEHDLKTVSEGKEVDVNVLALDKKMKGVVSSISKEAVNENGVAYFTAVVDLEEAKGLRAGMNAEAKILDKRAENILALPIDAVMFDGKDNPYVLIPVKEGNPKRKYIKTGMNDGVRVEVKEGLKEGQTVVIPAEEETKSQNGFMPPAPSSMQEGNK